MFEVASIAVPGGGVWPKFMSLASTAIWQLLSNCALTPDELKVSVPPPWPPLLQSAELVNGELLKR